MGGLFFFILFKTEDNRREPNMFKKLFSLFSKKEQIEETVQEEIIVEEKKPLPDIIEVPWKDAAGAKNFEDSITKMHSDLKEFYYKTKMNEYRAIKAIERLEESTDKKVEEIKKLYGIENSDEYHFEIPAATGKPGFLKKKKTNK